METSARSTTALLNERFEYTGRPLRKLKLVELRSARTDFIKNAVMPWHGTVLIGSLLKQEGYDIEALLEDMSEFDERDLAQADAVLVHQVAGNLEKNAQLIARARRLNPSLVAIGGGGLAKVVPSAGAESVDFIVRGEGEDTIVELLETLNRGGDVRQVAGVSYWHDGQLKHTQPRAFTKRLGVPTSMSVIRGYRKMSFLEQAWRRRFYFMTIEASRGCPFACKFCITPDLYGSYRTRDVDRVLDELRERRKYSTRIWFIDNLFVVKRDFIVELLERMVEEGLHEGGNYTCFLRVENAQDEAMLPLLRKAGFTNVYVGFESLDVATQREWNKVLKLKEMGDCIDAYHRHGIRVHGSFLMGSDGQRAENIVSTMEWAEEHGCDYISMYCLIPTQMAENVCIPRHRMLAPSWDYVNGNYVTFFPLHMKPSTLQTTVLDCLDRFYHPKRIPGKVARLGRVNNPWLFGGALAGIWATLRRNRAEFDKYTEYLRSVEGEFYDADEQLIEERLPRAGIRPEVPFVDTPDPAVRVITLGKQSAARFTAPQCNS
jgi:anaerobic magnesium-protoporphyrin IX monomethyl ester cyclase